MRIEFDLGGFLRHVLMHLTTDFISEHELFFQAREMAIFCYCTISSGQARQQLWYNFRVALVQATIVYVFPTLVSWTYLLVF